MPFEDRKRDMPCKRSLPLVFFFQAVAPPLSVWIKRCVYRCIIRFV